MDDTPDTQPDAVIYPPSDRLWFDPRVIAENCYLWTRDFPLLPNVVTRVADNNPGRVSVGFSLTSGAAGVPSVFPMPDVIDTVGYQLPFTGILWFKMFDYFNLVMGEWYALMNGNITIRVWEIRRLT